MKFKALIYSDCHFSQYSSIVRQKGDKYSVRLENLIKSISWAEDLADKNNCDYIICAGDFFDKPDLKAAELTALKEVYFSPKPHIFLTGNHDSNILSLEYSSIRVFEKMFSAKIVTEPWVLPVGTDVDIYFIPYITANKEYNLSDYVEENGKKRIIITHNDIAGIQYGKFTATAGFNIEDILKNCTLFLDGHLHNGCTINNKIVLLGNITGQNFNEDASKYDHNVYILEIDGDKITLESIINPYALNFYKIKIENEKDIELLNSLKNNSVLSVSCNERLFDRVENKLNELNNVITYRLTTIYNTSSELEDIDFTVEDHIQQFINFAVFKLGNSELLTEELSHLR